MDFISNHSPDQANRPIYFDISPERLNAMSPSELEASMEKAIDAMTEETYCAEIIAAYLDALDRVSPIPKHLDAQSAYRGFQERVQSMAFTPAKADGQKQTKASLRLGNVLRVGLAAAIVAACLFGSMVVAQASGLDVFGAIARWTDSVFTFGSLPNEGDSNHPSDDLDTAMQTDFQNGTVVVPPEYEELQETLEERGLPLRLPLIPDGFDVADSKLYIDPTTQNVEYSIAYTQEKDYIGVEFRQNEGGASVLYEKNRNDVEIYEYNEVNHYIFCNEGTTLAVWVIGTLEYCISTNSSVINIRELIQSVYKE